MENTEDDILEDNNDADSLDLSDLSNISNEGNKGLLLLRRLQQLKVWQARQEALLLEEQRQQLSFRISEVEKEKEQEQVEDTEDDTTISSLESDHEPLPGPSLTSPSPDRREDLPLSGGGKTFEQLMAEKLTGKESEGGGNSTVRKVVTPKPFLKRGSGLSRFNLPADSAKQPGRLRSRTEQVGAEAKEGNTEPAKPVSRKLEVAPRYLNAAKNTNSKISPARKNKSNSGQSPVKLKLKPSKSSTELAKPRSVSPPKPAKFNLCDSVENSFCDKLSLQAQRHIKDMKELEVFQLLEDAANDSSFCSNSSQIKSLVTNAILPTPNKMGIPTPHRNMSIAKTSFASSTPASHLPSSASDNIGQADLESYDPTMGESLMEDIRKFLQAKVASTENDSTDQSNAAINSVNNGDVQNESDWTDESDDSTLNGEEDVTIGRDWQAKMALARYEDKENSGPGSAQVLEFSPPEKLPANPPSHLIWEIFGRERERIRKQKQQEEKKVLMTKKTENSNVAAAAAPKKSLNVRFENPLNGESTVGTGAGAKHVVSEASQDLSFQSTLLHMRVVELEQEIDNFKKENKKICTIKKKLQSDKEKLTKELAEFETLKETEKKKIEEEKRRLKRDKLLLEKGKKQHLKGCDECEEKGKQVDLLSKELKSKELKWTDEVNKLKEQLKKSQMDQQELKNENQKLRLKKVSSKVGFVNGREVGPEVVVRRHLDEEEEDSGFQGQTCSLSTSEQQSSEEDMLDTDTRKTITDTIYDTLCQGDTPRIVSSPDTETEVPGVGAREKRFSDGRVEVWYSNGNRKEVSADGGMVKLFYYNGDVKETHSDGMVRYLYSHTQTWHTTNTDGSEILQFSNGQEETRLPDGSSSISFPDGSIKTISAGGVEKITFPDTTVVVVQPNGDRTLELPNGQVEEHTSQHKKRSYPDGTVKIVHMDGRQETRYAGGRVRVKDSKGVLLQDTGP